MKIIVAGEIHSLECIPPSIQKAGLGFGVGDGVLTCENKPYNVSAACWTMEKDVSEKNTHASSIMTRCHKQLMIFYDDY